MSRSYLPSLIFAGMMMVFAVLARLDLADRQTVEILLLVLPILAVTQTLRGRTCCANNRQEA